MYKKTFGGLYILDSIKSMISFIVIYRRHKIKGTTTSAFAQSFTGIFWIFFIIESEVLIKSGTYMMQMWRIWLELYKYYCNKKV